LSKGGTIKYGENQRRARKVEISLRILKGVRSEKMNAYKVFVLSSWRMEVF